MSVDDNNINGVFYGVGVGPGDPELLTLKAVRLIASADLLVYPATLTRESTARSIASAHIRSGQRELAIGLPMSPQDRDSTQTIYRQAADTISQALHDGAQVVFLCLGDPLLYGSFIYLYDLLKAHHHCCVAPGVTSISAASAASLTPLTRLDQTLLTLPAFSDDENLYRALRAHDSLAIMKVGRQRQRIVNLLRRAERCRDAVYIEHASMANETIIGDVEKIPAGPGPYFSLFLVSRQCP